MRIAKRCVNGPNRSRTTLKGPLPVETRGLAVAPSAIKKFITSSFVYISRCGVNKETGWGGRRGDGGRGNVEPDFSKILREITIGFAAPIERGAKTGPDNPIGSVMMGSHS